MLIVQRYIASFRTTTISNKFTQIIAVVDAFECCLIHLRLLDRMAYIFVLFISPSE